MVLVCCEWLAGEGIGDRGMGRERDVSQIHPIKYYRSRSQRHMPFIHTIFQRTSALHIH